MGGIPLLSSETPRADVTTKYRYTETGGPKRSPVRM